MIENGIEFSEIHLRSKHIVYCIIYLRLIYIYISILSIGITSQIKLTRISYINDA